MKEGYEIHEIYVKKYQEEIENSKEIIVEVMPLATFSRKLVKAVIAGSPKDLPGGEKLWIREESGRMPDEPMGIKIIDELDPEEVEFKPESSD